MAYEIGTADGHKDLLAKLMAFLIRANVVDGITYGSGNSGDGVFSLDSSGTTELTADDNAPTETWTLTCTVQDSSGTGHTFSVVGSISGAQDNMISGTAYDDIVQFLLQDGAVSWDVGDTVAFNVTTKLGVGRWEVLRYRTNYSDNSVGSGDNLLDHVLELKGVGNAGTDEIFVGIKTRQNEGQDTYNWLINGYTGWNIGVTDFYSQQGAIENSGTTSSGWCPKILLSNATFSYWFVANGRRFIVVAKVGSGVYECCYGGFILPYGTPNQIPYPLVIGGSAQTRGQTDTAASRRHSSVLNGHRAFPYAYWDGQTDLAQYNSSLLVLDSFWIPLGAYISDISVPNNRGLWPANCTDYITTPEDKPWYKLKSNIDGTYRLFPVIPYTLSGYPNANIYGELDGVKAVPGIGLNSEDTLTDGGDSYVVFQDTFRTQNKTYWALKLG